MTRKMSCLIIALFSLTWASTTVAQTGSGSNEKMPGIEKGAYDIPLGVKLSEFLKWCSDNHVKVMNDSFLGKKKAIEKEVEEILVNKLIHEINEKFEETNTKSLRIQTKKIMSLKTEELKGLLEKIRDGKNVPFQFGEFNAAEPLAEIEYIQGPLYLFRYGGEDYIMQSFFKSENEIKNIILDKLQHPRGKNHDREEINSDIFEESMVESVNVSGKLFKSRYLLSIDLQNREAKDNGIEQIEVLFFRDQSDELKSYTAIYYCSPDYTDILIKSLTNKYGRPKINNSRDSINEISQVENIYLNPCYDNKDFDINVEQYSSYATRGWKENIFIYHIADDSPARLVYHENVLWPQIRKEFENELDNAVENYKKLINSHGDQVQDRL